MASPLSVGDRAPDFTLTDQDGVPVRLAGLLEQGPVVLFFYPIAASPGCTAEACHFRDLAAGFAAVGAQRVGISTDAVDKQKSFDSGHGLGYPLLSDVDGAVATAFGVKRGLLGRFVPVERMTFVIGTDAVITHVVGSETKMAAHADGALAALHG